MKKNQSDYLAEKHAYDLKMLEKSNGLKIVSPEDGIVNHVNATEGDHVIAGKQFFTLITKANTHKLETIMFVNHSQGKKVRVGMDVNVLPNGLSAYDYGYIKGKVISVTEYPTSRDAVNTYFGNLNLVDEYFAGGVPYMIKVALTADERTKSGLKWTTKVGSPFVIKPGTTIIAKIVTTISSPINLILKKVL